MILEASWDGLGHFLFGLSQFHGHGSWLVCEVALNQAYHMHKASLDARRSELRRIPIRSNFRVFLTARIKGKQAMMGAGVAGLSPQLLSSSSSSSSSTRRILFNLQSQSPSCAAACKVQAASSFPFTAPASGVSTFSHLNSIAWIWYGIVWYRFLQFTIIKTCSWGCHT